jgi:hypothetical protein
MVTGMLRLGIVVSPNNGTAWRIGSKGFFSPPPGMMNLKTAPSLLTQPTPLVDEPIVFPPPRILTLPLMYVEMLQMSSSGLLAWKQSSTFWLVVHVDVGFNLILVQDRCFLLLRKRPYCYLSSIFGVLLWILVTSSRLKE